VKDLRASIEKEAAAEGAAAMNEGINEANATKKKEEVAEVDYVDRSITQ
jgi:hypothetical protein